MTQEENPEVKLLIEEKKKIYTAVASLTFAWANIENTMVLLLGTLLKNDTPIASAIYFSPAAIDQRFKIVDSAFKHLIGITPMPEAAKVEEIWAKLLTDLHRIKKTRNKVAHGQVVTSSGADGKNHIRLTDPLFNFQKMAEYFQKTPPQIPGMSANDIETSVKVVHEKNNELGKFISAVRFLLEKNSQELLKLFPELAPGRTTSPPQPDAQTTPTPEAPHQSERS